MPAEGDDPQGAAPLRESERRLRAVVDSLAEAVTIRGRDQHVIYANQAALDRLGFTSAEELRAADPHALMEGYEVTAEDGRPIGIDELPSMRLLRGEEPRPLLLRSVDRDTGDELWSLLKTRPVHDPDGRVEAAVTIIEDVSERQRAALRMEFLARASHVLSSSLDYEQTLRNVAGLAVPDLADWCGVDLLDDAGRREPVAVVHSDPAKIALAERLRAYEPERVDPERGFGRVIGTGQPVMHAEIPEELLREAAVDDEHLALLRAVGMRSVLIVPMRIRGRTIGALTMVTAESGRAFSEADVEFAEQIAERAAVAVENSRLYTERAQEARTLQRSLLPEAIPRIPAWEVSVVYRPAGHGNVVGGDFYDLWEAGGDWLMMIGDVTGKGVGAAAITSLVRHTAWTASEFEPEPACILARVDSTLKRRPALSLCTALCMRFSGGKGTIAVGGHPLPLIVGPAGLREVGHTGVLLGAFDDASWTDTPVTFQAGETLVAFTDGVTDAVGADGQRFGSDRLCEVIGQTEDRSPAAIRERLVRALDEFQVGAQADDTALVIMRYTGTGGASAQDAGQLADEPLLGVSR